MSNKYLVLFLFPLVSVVVGFSKPVVDCKSATGVVTVCNPYSFKFLRAKSVKYEKSKQKLIVDKTLPVPPKKVVKVISVLDMVDKYVKIEESIRYKGAEDKEKSIAKDTSSRRNSLIEKMEKIYKEQAKKREEGLRLVEELEKKRLQKLQLEHAKTAKETGYYTIQSGDSLSRIAAKFSMKTKDLVRLNKLDKKSIIRVGKKLIVPFLQEKADAIAKARYIVKSGDSLSTIAKAFNLTAIQIKKYNKLKDHAPLKLGQKIRLPLPYVLAKKERERKQAKARKLKLAKTAKRTKMIHGFGKRKLRVTATAYSSHGNQTDKTPFLAAWNNRLRPGMKIIAVSRDMLTKYGLRNGSKVKIGGLPGYYTVRDKMNKRYRKRIDIYMGINRRKALRWGRRSVMLYF